MVKKAEMITAKHKGKEVLKITSQLVVTGDEFHKEVVEIIIDSNKGMKGNFDTTMMEISKIGYELSSSDKYNSKLIY